MSEPPFPDSNQSPTPDSGIQQSVENSTMKGGMQAAQGNGNTQHQNNNSSSGNTTNVTVKVKQEAPKRDRTRANSYPFARAKPLKTCLKLLLLFILSVGLGQTIHATIIQHWQEAFLFLLLTVILTLLILAGIFLFEFLNRLYQNWELGQQQLAVRLADVIWSEIEVLVWEFTSPFKRRYYQSLIYNCRDYRTQGLKIKGPFTLDLEKMFVTLKVTPESAERISQAMIQSNERESSQSIWDFLVSSCTYAVYRSIAIIGPPGSGKTTLLEHLALSYAKNVQRQQHRKAPQLIPILLYLRDVRNTFTNQTSLSELIEGQKSISKLNPPQGKRI